MRILFVLPRFPYPLDKGDKLRAYHQLRELAQWHEVHLFALSHEAVDEHQLEALRPYCASIQVARLHAPATWWGVLRAFLTGTPLQVGYWTTKSSLQAYRQCLKQVQPEAVYGLMVRIAPYLMATHCRTILDYQDALSLNIGRRRDRTRPPLRWLLNYESRALHRYEQLLLRAMSATTIIGQPDREAISPMVTLAPNGVDFDYFTPSFPQPEEQFSVVFCGNMSYAPNVDAAQYLVREVMPRVWVHHPHATVLLAGADPKPAVRALASAQVKVSGRLPDIRTAYASATLFVAPMRIGSGMQNKLLEAMAMQRPCITTPIASTPLGVTAGEHLLVGDSAESLSNHISTLLSDNHLRKQLAASGYAFARNRYSWAAAVAPLENLLLNTNQ